MIRSKLCDNSDAYILVSGTITINGAWADDAAKWVDKINNGVIFKNCASFIEYIIKINNTQIDKAKDIDIVMPMYNLIECSDDYSKTSGSLWQYYRDKPNDNITESESFRSKIKITGNILDNGNTKNVVSVSVSLKKY